MTEKIQRTIDALKANNIEVFYAENKETIPDIVKSILNDGDTISCGGSVTLKECGVEALMRCGDYNFLDRAVAEDVQKLYRDCFSADAYLTSANAVTENGELINVDGNANRVSCITFGPKKIICVVGANKIVRDINEGFKRVKTVAAPKNAVRLNTNTPCKELGHCVCVDGSFADGCKSPQRICSQYVITAFQRDKNRIKVIITPEALGY